MHPYTRQPHKITQVREKWMDRLIYNLIIEPRHDIPINVVCATSKASDQPAHTRSLIRAFAGHLNIL